MNIEKVSTKESISKFSRQDSLRRLNILPDRIKFLLDQQLNKVGNRFEDTEKWIQDEFFLPKGEKELQFGNGLAAIIDRSPEYKWEEKAGVGMTDEEAVYIKELAAYITNILN
jgi:hypothetical protein